MCCWFVVRVHGSQSWVGFNLVHSGSWSGYVRIYIFSVCRELIYVFWFIVVWIKKIYFLFCWDYFCWFGSASRPTESALLSVYFAESVLLCAVSSRDFIVYVVFHPLLNLSLLNYSCFFLFSLFQRQFRFSFYYSLQNAWLAVRTESPMSNMIQIKFYKLDCVVNPIRFRRIIDLLLEPWCAFRSSHMIII